MATVSRADGPSPPCFRYRPRIHQTASPRALRSLTLRVICLFCRYLIVKCALLQLLIRSLRHPVVPVCLCVRRHIFPLFSLFTFHISHFACRSQGVEDENCILQNSKCTHTTNDERPSCELRVRRNCMYVDDLRRSNKLSLCLCPGWPSTDRDASRSVPATLLDHLPEQERALRCTRSLKPFAYTSIFCVCFRDSLVRPVAAPIVRHCPFTFTPPRQWAHSTLFAQHQCFSSFLPRLCLPKRRSEHEKKCMRKCDAHKKRRHREEL